MSSLLSGQNALIGAVFGLIGVIVGAFIKTRAPLAKINADREANLLHERAKEMQEMRERIAHLEDQLTVALEELRVVRHDLANANQSLDMFIALIEANPERAAEHAAKVKEHRDKYRKELRHEKEAVLEAKLGTLRGKAQ